MKYSSIKKFQDVEINLATATLEELNDAYNSLLILADDGGAFPTSKSAQRAKVYGDQLRELKAARPEIISYRNQLADDALDVRLAGKDIRGM